MSVKERVKIFAKSENMSISSFEKAISSSNGYVNSISKSIGLDKIELILENFPNLSLEWLLCGRGDMLKEKNILIEKPDPLRDKIIGRQDQLIDKLEKEVSDLKKEVINLKKATKSHVYSSMVAESTEKLTKTSKEKM